MRILVVDDEEISRAKLETLLAKYGACDAVDNGAAAIEMFIKAHDAGAPYELVTMDIDMPGMKGLEVVRRIREWEQTKKPEGAGENAKILMVTVMDDMKSISSAFWEGCEAYMTKPISPDKIKSKLEELYIYPAT